LEATVTEELPQHLYRIRTHDGRVLTAGPSEEVKRLGLEIRTGRKVLVRLAGFDPTRGIIVGLATL
jgi:translation initiation factor IF-1